MNENVMIKINYLFLYIFFISFLTINLTVSQNTMKRVQYGIKLNKENQSLPSDYVGLITDVDFKLTQVKFDLSFSDKISKFSLNDNSLSDEDNFVILDIINMKFIKSRNGYAKQKKAMTQQSAGFENGAR